jgi:opine dehydrogenase
MEWLLLAYNVEGETLYECIQNQTGYYVINAPSTLKHRYISEDVSMSLVPSAALGERYGVSVNGINAFIRLGCILHSTDYWRKGRTVEKLGNKDLSVTELTRYVNEGVREF